MKKKSRLGKWLLIFGLIAFVSAIAFGISVAMLGVTNNNYSINFNGTDINFIGGFNMGKSGIRFNDNGNVIDYEYETDKDYHSEFAGSAVSDISIELAKCEADVTCGSDDVIKVKYTSGNGPMIFEAKLDGKKLTVSEKGGFLSWLGGSKSSKLKLEIPEKIYSNVTLNIASGSLNADKLVSSDLDANIASGSVDLGVFADDMQLSVASGRINLKNCTENDCRRIKVQVASGNVQVDGFGSQDTDVDIASGKVTLTGVCGNVKGDIMSGTFTLEYKEWNGDLDIDIASGKTDVTLPAGSGIDLDFDRASGSCKVDLDGNSDSFSKDTKVTIGGQNIHRVKIDVASGSTSIHN